MLSRYPRIRLLVVLTFAYFVLFALMRVTFWAYFLEGRIDQPATVLANAWSIGLRFDFRLALIMAMPVVAISLLPGPLGLKGWAGRTLAGLWILLATLGAVFTYIVDFAHYAYLDERVNVSVMRFLEDGRDSFLMVWESYPVIGLLALLFSLTGLFYWLFRRQLQRYMAALPVRQGWVSVAVGVSVFVICLFGLMGKVGTTIPLRWSDAYFASDLKVATLALNPVVFFVDTYNHRTKPYDEDKVQEYYPQVAAFLGLDEADREHLDFVRKVPASANFERPPNVVFIHLESMGANRMGLFGNETDATPYLDRFGREGLFFSNFMVPSSGTARTVFGLVTGIPDVSWGGTTASRNPLIVDQYTLVNEFRDYNRLYFIGGSAGWANIKGVLESNIDNLELWEEGDWQGPNVDVWGISDYSLFREAHQRLEQLPHDEPFLAFIQTAGNHRPFTIPDEGSGFEVRQQDESWLKSYGFLGADQYNAVRLLDFNVGYYLDQLAANSWYGNNTIFVMYGDHNDSSSVPSVHMGYSEKLYLDKHHVPLIIYAPGLLEPRTLPEPTSLVDIMPTVLGIIGLPYENRTLGRDVLSLDDDAQRLALTFGGDRTNRPLIGLVGPEYHFSMHYDGSEPHLYPLHDNPSLHNDVAGQMPELASERQAMLHGIYQTARYMLHHNRRGKADQ